MKKLTAIILMSALPALAVTGAGCKTKKIQTLVLDPSVTQTDPIAGTGDQPARPMDDRLAKVQAEVTRVEAELKAGIKTLAVLKSLHGVPQSDKFNEVVSRADAALARVQSASDDFFNVVKAMKTFDATSLKAAFASLPGVIDQAVPALKDLAAAVVGVLNQYHVTDIDPNVVQNSIDLAATILESAAQIIPTYFN